jgi:hypothetical protein
LDPLVPNQMRYRAALHSEDTNHNGWDGFGQATQGKKPDFSGFFYEGDILIVNFAGLDDEGARQRRFRITIGIALSLVLHALLLSAWRSGQPRAPGDESEPPRSIAVWLRPPPPAPVAEEAPPRARQAPAPVRERKRARRSIALEPAPAPPGAPVVTGQPTPQAAPEPAAPRFDVEAARKFARRIANDPDPERAGTAVGQFPKKPLETESRAARAISGAHRPDCKDGIPGGLLAPLILLLDKKDSGCKW